jgi:hypothetical protein
MKSQINVNAQIVELINGIISHGNHAHVEYTAQQFEDMLLLAALEQIEESDIDSNDLELIELYETLESKIGSDDYNIDFDGNEYRIISDSSIWEIYVEEIKNIVTDCYDLNLDAIPSFIAVEIDWEQTATNAHADGYGHTFASYDHEESEAAGFWIFRTN